MSNGFVTSSPASRHGSTTYNAGANSALSQKFTCPGSGTQEITEIGLWCSADAATTAIFHLAIFTHDAANNNPDVIVSNSDSGELSHNTTTITKINYSYGTLPQLTGGTVYWLALINGDGNMNLDLNDPGGTTNTVGGISYPTWPTEAQWDSGADIAWDMSLYAVYQAAGGGGGPSVLYPSRNRLVNAGITGSSTRAAIVNHGGH